MSKLTLVETDFFNICSVKKLLVKNHADLSIVGFSCEFFRQGAISFSQCLQENSFLESVFIKATVFNFTHNFENNHDQKITPANSPSGFALSVELGAVFRGQFPLYREQQII